MTAELKQRLFTLHKLKGVGPATLRKIVALPDVASASLDQLATRSAALAKALERPGAWEEAVAHADADIEAAQKAGARIHSVLDEDYPALLRVTRDAPFFLYVRGTLSQSPERSVCIIGTRQPTEHGRKICERITQFFVEEGWSVVSGLALGCDSIAHETALRAKGHTVGVLAHGLHTVAPKQNERLAEQILEKGGSLVTEYAFGVEPVAHQFVKRDRIQAGLAKGVVMIQSDLEGGSLHASRAAIEYGRFLLVPAPTEQDAARGEKKIEANTLLVGADPSRKAEFLKCGRADLRRVVAIYGKEDYQTLTALLSGSPESIAAGPKPI